MRYENDKKKYQICHHQIRFSSSKCTKIRLRPGLRAPDPAGGAYDAPPDPLVPPRSTPSASRTRRIRRLGS